MPRDTAIVFDVYMTYTAPLNSGKTKSAFSFEATHPKQPGEGTVGV